MLEKNENLQINKDIERQDLNNLVSVFAWLIQEDKKQNPELYNTPKKTNL